jgi:hypothetical protein
MCAVGSGTMHAQLKRHVVMTIETVDTVFLARVKR